ncbi:class I SAM-dependent DNA methyltransferase [Streptomyces jumonjinensis]|uniref:class I SAM-dependent DNA methyltransferase n=1 Tax=Streptomyces jumonjinensis TaxID=1945 RepID=UPI0037B39EA8
MTSDAVVTAAEIARIAGVGPAAVSNWRRRYPEFPAPVGGTATSPHFSLTGVVDWLRDSGRPVSLSPADVAWRHLDAVRDPARPGAVLAAAGAFLAGERPAPTAGGELPELPELPGLPVEIIRLIDGLGSELGAAGAFEALLSRWAEAHARQVETTPAPVAALMAELLTPADGQPTGPVLDPACGTGSLLLATAAAGAEALLGQETDPDLAEITRLRLALHGCARASVTAGDSLLADAFTGKRAHAVVCNPPFGQRHWGRGELGYDSRWTFGLPPNGEPELAWLQHALAHLADSGYAALLMPAAAAARPSGRRVRAELIRRGSLRAVVALPAGSTSTHAMGTHLWIARPPAASDADPPVLFVDAEHALAEAPDQDQCPGKSWQFVRDTVLPPWRAFQRGEEAPRGPYCHVSPATDLLDDAVDLTPARHIPAETGAGVDRAQLAADRTRWQQALEALAVGPPAVEWAPAERRPAALVSLEDLARTGAVRIWRGSARRETGSSGPLSPAAHSRRPPAERSRGGERETIREGDVLLPGGASGGPRPAGRAEAGTVPGPGVTVLRPDPAVLDSWFLSGALSDGAAGRRLGGGSGSAGRSGRVDIARLFVPVLDLAEQRRIGKAFQDIAAFGEALENAVDRGREAARRLADALAAGQVRPLG